MTWPPRWEGSQFKHEQTPAVVQRARRKADKADALADAYAEVDKRDGSVCRATGAFLTAGSPDAKTRREHHHLKGRRVMPEWRHEPARIVTVSKAVHDLITAGWIVVEGVDASLPNKLRFQWRPDVPTKLRIVVLLSRRKSQRTEP